MLKLLAYLRPYWKAAVAAPLLMLLEVVMDLMQPTLAAGIIDNAVMTGDGRRIPALMGVMIGAALVGAVGGIGCAYFSSMASVSFGADLRESIFKKVQTFSFKNLDSFEQASLITRLTNDVTQVQHIVLFMLRMLVRAPLLCIGGVIMAVAINPRLTLILAVSLPITGGAIVYLLGKGFPLFASVQKKLDKVNAVTQENLSGVRVIKAFVRADYERRKFAVANEELMNMAIRAGRLMGYLNPITMVVINCSIIAVLWFGGRHISAGRMQVGEVIAFIHYMTQILHSIMMVAFFLMNISRAKASADRIRQVFDTEVDIVDQPDASDAPIAHGRVSFENVSFRYEGAGGAPVLKNISFTAEPGETVAILGATGSGKSTLVGLIPRFYDVTAGRVTVDGRDVRSIKLHTLRESIGMVLQESILFTGTIRENLSWGAPQATDEEIAASAKAAQAHDFVASFPDGYDTVVGQRGVNLSGGQKQRLAIARALLKRPKILIMDDSTSAVDLATEARLQAALKELIAESTCFIIAQRISSVLDADRIIVLEDGEIVGSGTHAELMRTCAVYQDICRSQLNKEAV